MILNIINGKILFTVDTTINGVVYKAETWNVFGSLSNVNIPKQAVYITKTTTGYVDFYRYATKVGELKVNQFNYKDDMGWGNSPYTNGLMATHNSVNCNKITDKTIELIFKGDSVPEQINSLIYTANDDKATYSPISPLKFNKGGTIKLTANPIEGYKFDADHLPSFSINGETKRFTEDILGSAIFNFDDSYDGKSIAIDSNAVEKYPAPTTYTIEYTVGDEEASYSPASPIVYDIGSSATLIATPNEGYAFKNGNLPQIFNGFNYFNFVLNNDGTAQFTFTDGSDFNHISIFSNAYRLKYSINVTIAVEGDDASKVDINPTSPIRVESGNPVIVNIIPKSGWTFSSDSIVQYGKEGMMGVDWVDCDKPSANSRTFTLTCEDDDSDYTMYVQVSGLVASTPSEKKTHYSFTTSSEHFSITPGMSFDVTEGSNVTVRIMPSVGWRIGDNDSASVIINGNTIIFNNDGNSFYHVFTYDSNNTTLTGVLSVTLTQGEIPGVVRTNFFTIYEPTDDNMKAINNAIFIDSTGEITGVVDRFISYKKFYVDIPTDGVSQLKAGQYDFDTTAPVVHQLVLNYSCGELNVNEKYGSLLDYSGYTSIRIYLPFVGFVEADVNRIMGNKIKINYIVDVQSGKCLAQVMVKSVSENGKADNEWVCIDEHSGIISRDEPINQGYIYYKGNYEVLSTVQLGELNAYLLITRKIPNEGNIGDYLGYPGSEVVTVGDCSGYVSFKQIHCDGVVCTDDERTMIENVLKKGIIVS